MSDRLLTIKEYIRRKAFGINNGAVETGISPNVRANETTFINDPNEIQRLKLEEYNVWYAGDSAQILNFYTRADFIDFNYDPIYNRNMRNLFWAESASEADYKRTHSGQPRNMVDTLSGIVSVPHITVLDEKRNARLKRILKENNYDELLSQEARPLTLVEGWGGWKINFNEEVSDTPILLYYRANSVDFIYRNRRLVCIVYQDYYTDEDDKKYVLFETRRLERRDVVDDRTGIRAKKLCLVIEKELFEFLSEQVDRIKKVPLNTLPELEDVEPCLVIENCPYFLGAPNIYYHDSTELSPGRSIFTGKIDLFDDLDKTLSQASNAVTRSTPIEYIDSQYLERDENTGQPKQPKLFDRKYIMISSVLGGDSNMARQPITVTQPQIDFNSYSVEAKEILMQILNGVLSPATIGLEVSKDQNALAQREKEKVTIFTRNGLITTEKKIQESLMIQLLIADELLHSDKNYNAIERPENDEDWGISVVYDEFADASYDAKLETVLAGWQGGLISDEMAIEYLYRDATPDIRKRELDFIKEQRANDQKLAGRGGNPDDPNAVLDDDDLAELGEELGGMENNSTDEKRMGTDPLKVKERNGIPDITNYRTATDDDSIQQK